MRIGIITIFLVCCLSSSLGQTKPLGAPQERPARVIHEDLGSPTGTVRTFSRRPLEDALRVIGREYGWAIDYEEAPTINPTLIVDDDADLRSKYPNVTDEDLFPLFPKGQPFSSTFPEDHNRQADISTVMRRLLSDYNASGNPGRYKLEIAAGGQYVVVGDAYESEDDSLHAYTPILDCNISLIVPALGLHAALGMVASQVNETCKGSNISAKFAAELDDQLTAVQVFGTYQDMAARDVINNLLAQERGVMYYTVEFVPRQNKYNLFTWLGYTTARAPGGGEVLEPMIRATGNL